MKLAKTLSLPAFALATGFATVVLPGIAQADGHSAMAEYGTMQITKSPTCGCCAGWAELARAEGYDVEITDTADVSAAKIDVGVPDQLWACHTTEVAGYVIEGHVPFEAVAQLLEERPDIAGIAVPGMPGGSPGMGDDPNARFDVIAFGGDAEVGEVFYQAGL